MRLAFFGTPEFAVPTLEALAAAGRAPLLVVTQPARPAGRGKKLQDPPVFVAAKRLGLPAVQVEDVREVEFMAQLRALELDLAVVVAFGQIFRRSLLELPRFGCFNGHASLLPKYRGAAPIQAAIMAGERETGVTTMRMTRGLDSGPMLLKASLAIGANETAEQLTPRLADLGAEVMVATLAALESGLLVERPQDEALASYAPRLEKKDGEIDWHLPATRLYDRWRGLTPWPGLHSSLRAEPIRIVSCRPREQGSAAEPGAIVGLDDGLLAVACGFGTILGLERLQRPGRGAQAARDFWNGERLQAGEFFGA